MPAPAVTSTRHQRIGSATSFDASPVATPSVGEWVVVVTCIQSSTAAITPPAGWVVLCPITVIGTRSFGAWGKVYALSDSFVFSSSLSTVFSIGTVVGTGSDVTSGWIAGAVTTRGVASFDTVAASINTVAVDTLVLNLHFEASNAIETAAPTKTGGWTNVASYWNTVASVAIEAYDISSKVLASAGATGSSTATWQNGTTVNGGGLQVGIPPLSGLIPSLNTYEVLSFKSPTMQYARPR